MNYTAHQQMWLSFSFLVAPQASQSSFLALMMIICTLFVNLLEFAGCLLAAFI